MSRLSKDDPLDKFRFKIAFVTGDTTVFEADGKTVKLGPDKKPMISVTFSVGFHDIQLPKRTTTKGIYREGNSPTSQQIFAGLTSMEDIVLNKGVYSARPGSDGKISAQYNSDFYSWAQSVHVSSSTDKATSVTLGMDKVVTSSKDYKKDLCIVMLDRLGNNARAWKIYNAFPTHFVPGSDLNAAEDGEKSMESLTLAYEEFEEISPLDLV